MTHSPLTVRLATALRTLAAKTEIENSPAAAQPCGPFADDVRTVLAEYDAAPVSYVLVQGSDEHATVLAALRCYELQGQGEPCNRTEEIHRLATRNNKVVSLDESGIRELCMRLACDLDDAAHCCRGCGRDEADCSVDPCAGVIADRER